MENLLDKMRKVISDHKRGKLDRYDYMSQIHEFNKLLGGFQERLDSSEVESIHIDSTGVRLEFADPKMTMYIDGSCGSAPITSLNFGNNESQELKLILSMLNQNACIFDIGAHLGWYSLILGKTFPASSIYSFEPIPSTYSFLKKNLKGNNMTNVFAHNFGMFNKGCSKEFYYFRGGSAIASLQNLIDHDKIEKVNCELKTLDSVAKNFNISKLDFIKCDVEGAEIYVFEGGMKTIKKFLPIIFAEVCGYWCEKFNYKPNDIQLMLQNVGYRCFSADERALKMKEHLFLPDYSDNYNYFFLHQDKHKSAIADFVF